MPVRRFILVYLWAFVTLHAADIEFITQELPWAVVDKAYAPAPLEVRTSGACTSGGIGYAVVSGALPPGLQLSRLGYFSGVPLRTGSFDVILRVATGCSWTTQRFTLVSTAAPLLLGTPSKLEFKSSAASTAHEQVIHVTSTWPRLTYRATSSADWLTSAPSRGFTPREGSALADDPVRVRVDPSHLKPGRYQAVITISAWQAYETLRVGVELTVTE
jgi:Viral BACON domain